jgi:hypothetical protein
MSPKAPIQAPSSVARRASSACNHPRQDRWDQHFRLAAARIVPLSDEGESTVRLLDLNATDHLLLRKTLIKAARYPSIEALAYLRD